jgi:hypothetical protein
MEKFTQEEVVKRGVQANNHLIAACKNMLRRLESGTEDTGDHEWLITAAKDAKVWRRRLKT